MIVVYKDWKRNSEYKDFNISNIDDIAKIFTKLTNMTKATIYQNNFKPIFNEEPMSVFLRDRWFILQGY